MENRGNTFDRKTRDDNFLLKEAMLGFIQDLEIGNRTEKSIHNVRSTFRELLEHAEVQQWPRLTEVGKAEIRTLLVELKTRPKCRAGGNNPRTPSATPTTRRCSGV